MYPTLFRITISLAVFVAISGSAIAVQDARQKQIERGRYLVKTSGCNDCHTPGYPESGGKIPEHDWLVGSNVGFSGPWGTTYPVNLRNYVTTQSEAQWLARVRQPMRPPMPWFNLRDASDADLKAIYAYIKSLGAKAANAPMYVPPGQAVNTPFIEFVPKNLPAQQAQR